jgi:hypothetical protein
MNVQYETLIYRLESLGLNFMAAGLESFLSETHRQDQTLVNVIADIARVTGAEHHQIGRKVQIKDLCGVEVVVFEGIFGLGKEQLGIHGIAVVDQSVHGQVQHLVAIGILLKGPFTGGGIDKGIATGQGREILHFADGAGQLIVAGPGQFHYHLIGTAVARNGCGQVGIVGGKTGKESGRGFAFMAFGREQHCGGIGVLDVVVFEQVGEIGVAAGAAANRIGEQGFEIDMTKFTIGNDDQVGDTTVEIGQHRLQEMFRGHCRCCNRAGWR